MTRSRRLRYAARYSVMRLGWLMGTEPLRLMRSVHSYVELGAWARSIDAALPKPLATRFDLFELALSKVTSGCPLYLEFGVYRGESFHWWMEHLTNHRARFVGFDSFEGLPQDWNPRYAKGHFAVADAPTIHDERGHLERGWFDDTLPEFTIPEHDQLIVNIDCDIYSSSIFVLRQLEQFLVPGTLIYFDELNDRDHELRALQEFLTETGKHVEVLGSSKGGVNWLMQFV